MIPQNDLDRPVTPPDPVSTWARDNVDALASLLGSEVGKEAGPTILKQARLQLLTTSDRSGLETSEGKLALAIVLAGFTMVLVGAWKGYPDLQAQGVDLIKYVGAGYAVSRGLSKLGPKGTAAP